ncbi:hypothetical protein [Ancylobacter sp. SL191]|uniref:hypothetical protein n=1 Tax=Ancylobacter sp. SL191 TaxID=2995166 RepID=UPI00226E7452|nr:hypothetical protein [Ancylobacter sp. SL191]WAC26314.1 hypothetical protein OU996_15010 [Ancylobacter sp. SL191]
MKKRVTDDELLKLIHHVKAGQAAIPPIKVGDLASYDDHRRVADATVDELVKNYGARHSQPLGTHRLAMAGVTASCTSGHSGLLTNWINAAYRELDRRRA